jgi:hypothetical protein
MERQSWEGKGFAMSRCRHIGLFPDGLISTGGVASGLTLAQAMKWYWRVAQWDVNVSFGTVTDTDFDTGETATFGDFGVTNVARKYFGYGYSPIDFSYNAIPDTERSMVVPTAFTISTPVAPPGVVTGDFSAFVSDQFASGQSALGLFSTFLYGPCVDGLTYDSTTGLYLPGFAASASFDGGGFGVGGTYFELQYNSGTSPGGPGYLSKAMTVIVDGVTMGVVPGYYFSSVGEAYGDYQTLSAPDPVVMTCTPSTPGGFWAYADDATATSLYDVDTGAALFTDAEIVGASWP